MRQLDRQITLHVIQSRGAPNKWGERELTTADVPVWAHRVTFATLLLPTEHGDFEYKGFRAAWVVRYRADILPETTGFTDAAGQRWRVETVRELPERGRGKFLELTASTITDGTSIPPARRS